MLLSCVGEWDFHLVTPEQKSWSSLYNLVQNWSTQYITLVMAKQHLPHLRISEFLSSRWIHRQEEHLQIKALNKCNYVQFISSHLNRIQIWEMGGRLSWCNSCDLRKSFQSNWGDQKQIALKNWISQPDRKVCDRVFHMYVQKNADS